MLFSVHSIGKKFSKPRHVLNLEPFVSHFFSTLRIRKSNFTRRKCTQFKTKKSINEIFFSLIFMFLVPQRGSLMFNSVSHMRNARCGCDAPRIDRILGWKCYLLCPLASPLYRRHLLAPIGVSAWLLWLWHFRWNHTNWKFMQIKQFCQ